MSHYPEKNLYIVSLSGRWYLAWLSHCPGITDIFSHYQGITDILSHYSGNTDTLSYYPDNTDIFSNEWSYRLHYILLALYQYFPA